MKIPGLELDFAPLPAPVPVWHGNVTPGQWLAAAEAVREEGGRLVALWASKAIQSGASSPELLRAEAIFAAYVTLDGLFWLALPLAPHHGRLSYPDLSGIFPAAARMQRAAADLSNVHAKGMTDERAWLNHGAWAADFFPLLQPPEALPPVDARPLQDYAFVRVEGDGVHEIAVGPVHAGIIEPGHFRFLAVGEQVLNMEARLGYVHKGVERAMQGKSAENGVKLAGRTSGDCTVAHAWAFSQACEYAAQKPPPLRASFIRGVLCERERMANHIGDIGAICNDAAFGFMHAQMQRLREDMARLHAAIFGHRLLMDLVIPGGVGRDIPAVERDALLAQTQDIAEEVERLRSIYADHPSIQERVIGSGVVSTEDALDLGLLGYAGRASGNYPDERIEEAYPPYDGLQIRVAKGRMGDVATRVWVRFEEIADSARIIALLLEAMPEGAIANPWKAPEAGLSGFAAIEGWRGEIAAWVRFGEGGLVDRYFVRDPSVINWLGLELAVRGVPVPDFPLNNKSFNCSYAGNDL